MTAYTIVSRFITNADDANYYVAVAEQTVRSYLNYDNSRSLARFVNTVSNIALNMWRRDTAIAASTGTNTHAGVASESFSEGGVSQSYTYETASDGVTAYIKYEELNEKELTKISMYRLPHIPKDVMKC